MELRKEKMMVMAKVKVAAVVVLGMMATGTRVGIDVALAAEQTTAPAVVVPAADPAIPMRMRIAQDIDTLRGESTETSVRMLSEAAMYFWPGPSNRVDMRGLDIPLGANNGAEDVEAILSNRRVLKVLAECSRMSREDAGKIVREELHTALAEYKPMFDGKWARVLRVRQEHPVLGTTQYGVGPSLQASNNPDHTPTLSGLRLKILSLVLIAGNLRLSDVRDEIAGATRMAVEQRDMFYRSSEGTEADRFAMLVLAGIYNRQILMTAKYGMSSSSFDDEKVWERQRLTAFDAQATPYDLLTRFGGPIPPDYSKGSIDMRVHKPCGDGEFDEFMKEAMPARD